LKKASVKLPSLPPVPPERLAAIQDQTDAFSLASDLVGVALGNYPAGPNGELLALTVEGVPLRILRSQGKRCDIYVGDDILARGKLPMDAISILRDRLIKHWQSLLMKSAGVAKKTLTQDERETLRQLHPKNYVPGTRLLKG
jgi:hypothetical protein